MNELIINYNDTPGRKILGLLVGGYATLFGSYEAILQALNNTYAFDFFAAIVLLLLGMILVLNVTVWIPRPILHINSEKIYVKMPNQSTVYQADWISIREIALGISYMKMLETDGKEYSVDLGGLKYDDLKAVKSLIIELCESKSIPYKND